jgi:hypothetical protein
VEKTETYMIDKKKNVHYSNAFLRQAQDKLAQHDKELEAS